MATEKECRDGGANHPYDEIERQSEGTPGAFETFADEPEKPEREKHPQWTERLRKEDVGDEPPDLAAKNQSRIECQKRFEAAIKINQHINECGEANHDPDQPRNAQKTKTAFKFIQPGHCWRTLMSRSSRARWIALSSTRWVSSSSENRSTFAHDHS